MYLFRIAITGPILTSLNVVRMALLACDSSNLSAMRALKRLIGTRSSGRLPIGIGVLGSGFEACLSPPAACLTPPATAEITSPLVIRPSRPDPVT